MSDGAIRFPTRVFTSWIGLPEHETDKFVRLVSALIHGGVDPEARMAALMDAYAVLNQLISDRMAEPVAT